MHKITHLLKIHSLLLSNIFMLQCSQPEQKDASNDHKPLPISFLNKPNSSVPSRAPHSIISDKYLLLNAKLLLGNGERIEKGYIAFENGKILAVGSGNGESHKNAAIIKDLNGAIVTPGIIDTHSHMGVYASPRAKSHLDGNEHSVASSPSANAIYGVWPQDMAIDESLKSGVTTVQVLPGSANMIGGMTATIKLIPDADPRKMLVPGAPTGIKMACGENPKRVHGDKGGAKTRMGQVANHRAKFHEAWHYRENWRRYQRDLQFWKKRMAKASENEFQKRLIGDPPKVPEHDINKEVLKDVLDGKILVHVHCYRSDDMTHMLDMAEDFKFKIRSFHHALEAYKIRDRLAKQEVSISTWADWWGFKMEAFDGIPQNAGLLQLAGGKPVIHSDSTTDIRFLALEASKAAQSVEVLGKQISTDTALSWVTLNAAWALGLEDRIGSLEVGKEADIVVWNGSPFSIYGKADSVFINGKLVVEKQKSLLSGSDFEVGTRIAKDKEFKTSNPPAHKSIEAPLNLTIASESTLLINAKIFDQSTPTGKNASIFIKNDKIVDIGDIDVTQFQQNQIIDLQGLTVTPALIDGYTNLGTFEVPMEKSTVDYKTARIDATPGFKAVHGFNPNNARIQLSQSSGIGSVISSPSGYLLYGQGFSFDLIDNGIINKPIVNTAAMFGSIQNYFWNEEKMKPRGEQILRLQEIFYDANHLNRNRKDFLNGASKRLSLSMMHLEALKPYLNGRKPFVMSANRFSDINTLISFYDDQVQKDQKIQLVIEGASEAWLAKDELAKRKIPVILSPLYQVATSFDNLQSVNDNAKILKEAGVPLIISTTGRQITRLRQQAGYAVARGLKWIDALAAITENPAEIFQMENRGKLEKGYLANLVIWNGDPLEPTTEIKGMLMRGISQDLESRQTLLAKRYGQFPVRVSFAQD